MTTIIDGSASAEFETALPVAEGGTGATASTGSGNVVLSASPTLTGTVNAAAITASGDIKTTHAGNTAVEAISTGNSYATLKVKNSQQDYSAQIRTDQGQAFVIRDETAGVNRLLLSTAGTVTLSTPLPVASGGTGGTGGGGKVLQVVNANQNTQVSTSGGTWIDTGLTATITPSSTSSKILVLVDQVGLAKSAGNGGLYLKLLRGTTSLVMLCSNDVYDGTTSAARPAGVGSNYLDSPSTTSATTYKTQFYAFNSVTAHVQQGATRSTITLMEIAG